MASLAGSPREHQKRTVQRGGIVPGGTAGAGPQQRRRLAAALSKAELRAKAAFRACNRLVFAWYHHE